jgi:hypothetical protein
MPAPYEKESSRSYERVQTLSALAASRGGKLLSESYSSSRVKLSWEWKNSIHLLKLMVANA